MKRRFFFKAAGITTITGIFPKFNHAKNIEPKTELDMDWNYKGVVLRPDDETSWQKIGLIYPRNQQYTQLENGYFSHQALPVIHYHQEIANQINEEHSIFMRTKQDDAIERARMLFAQYQECTSDEIAFTRNTTESLNIAIMGFPWIAGDEVVIGDQDYGSMVEAFQQASKRWNIGIKVANIPIQDSEAWEQTCIEAYTKHISPKTKMVHITHPINLNGQGVPLLKIINRIKQINPYICIVVDAAHALSHFPETIGAMNADIVGSSLHKWTGAPLGLGCLYMKKTWIEKIWPLFGDTDRASTDIRKFEHQGTRPIQTIMSLEKAMEINHRIGIENRRNRLCYLKFIWQGNKVALRKLAKHLAFTLDEALMDRLTDLTMHPKIKFAHPLNPYEFQGAISTFKIDGKSANELASQLKENHRIFTVAINHPIIQGVRITPQLSNSVKDVVHLNQSICEIANS